MTVAEMNAAIAQIPGEHGWWHSDGRDRFEQLGADLVAKGFTPDEALDLLESAYSAVAGEFGG
jgi:hypothetical protein